VLDVGRAAAAGNADSYSAIDAVAVTVALEAYLALSEQIGSVVKALALASVVVGGFANDSSRVLQTATAC